MFTIGDCLSPQEIAVALVPFSKPKGDSLMRMMVLTHASEKQDDQLPSAIEISS